MNDNDNILNSEVHYNAAEITFGKIIDLLRSKNRIKRMYISEKPVGISEYSMVLVGNLLDKKRRDIGTMRIYVKVPLGGDDIKIVIEWTRYAYGFWYQKKFILNGAVNDIEEVNWNILKIEFEPVKWTADGTVEIDSMNRLFKKIKKNKAKDRSLLGGLKVHVNA